MTNALALQHYKKVSLSVSVLRKDIVLAPSSSPFNSVRNCNPQNRTSVCDHVLLLQIG